MHWYLRVPVEVQQQWISWFINLASTGVSSCRVDQSRDHQAVAELYCWVRCGEQPIVQSILARLVARVLDWHLGRMIKRLYEHRVVQHPAHPVNPSEVLPPGPLYTLIHISQSHTGNCRLLIKQKLALSTYELCTRYSSIESLCS